MVWYSYLFKNFPQFFLIHTVKGFGVVNEALTSYFNSRNENFWNSLAFTMIQQMLVIWSLVPLPFLNPAWRSGNSRFTYCWSLACRILSTTLLACEMNAIVQWFKHSLALPFFGTGMKIDLFQSCGHCWKWKWKWSRVQPSATPWTAAYQAAPSMGFSRQKYWSGVPLPSPLVCIR